MASEKNYGGRKKVKSIPSKKKKKKKKFFIAIIIVAVAAVIFLALNLTGVVNIKKILFSNTNTENEENFDNYSYVGCIKYMEHYMYFDQDGMVRESSREKADNIPLITGLEVDHVTVGENLPITDTEVFRWLLEVVLTLQKHDITLDKIYISDEMEMTLYIGDVRVELGKNEQTSEKITELSNFYEKLKTMSGTLYMQDFDLANKTFTFKENKK